MADLLKTGSDWLQGVLKTHATQSVTYHSGGDFVSVQATVGATEFEQENDLGIVERIRTRDFLVTATDLVIHGIEHEPERGDEIRETIDDTTYVYTVLSPMGEPEWRWSDRYHTTRRIHTTLTHTE